MAEFYTSDRGLPYIPDDITLAQFMLDSHHAVRPPRNGAPCLVDDKSGRPLSLKELKERTYGLANALNYRYNLGEHSTAMLFSPNHLDYPVAIWAVYRLGGIVTCSNPQFTDDELAYQLKLSKATLVIAHSAVVETALSAARLAGLSPNSVILLDQPPLSHGVPRMPTVRGLIAEGLKQKRTFDERFLGVGEGKKKIALLLWSSGTSGKPKAVALSHYAIISNIIQMAAHNQVDKVGPVWDTKAYRPGDVTLGVLPFYHGAGLVISLHFVLFCAMTLVVVQKYDFLDMLKSIIRYRITHLHLVPPQSIAFCKHPAVAKYNFQAVKYVMIGAAPVSREVQQELVNVFPAAQIGQAYGLTEMTTVLSMVSPTQGLGPLGSGGRLLPGIEARVIKADGTLALLGEPGELVVRGPSAALGYFNDRKATRETFIDGWVHTGDKVMLTHDREIFIFDRLKELIKVKGFQVAPAELEGCVLGHPDVVDCCVIGIPDVYSGELPLAYAVLSSDAVSRISCNPGEAEEIRASIAKHVADRKVGYKHLNAGVEFIDAIPKNGSGKLLRRVLREKAKTSMLQETRARL